MIGPYPIHEPRPLDQWRDAFSKDFEAGAEALREAVRRLDSNDPTWIATLSVDGVEREIARLRMLDPTLPLFGVPFAVKDNIDADGWDTTAACPAYAYQPEDDAPVVARLRAAGAVLLGKANLDQFATGLVGTRSPIGVPVNPFHPDRVPGGSSAGSAVAVARGLVAFSLGTDTAGSGRVPAAFNNLVGLKPTRGLLSTRGVVPACASLDCVSIFALTESDAWRVLDVAAGFDAADPWSREPQRREAPAIRTLAIPQSIDWHGDTRHEQAWRRACSAAEGLGLKLEPVDFSPFHELAELLYSGPWVAERTAAVGTFIAAHPEAVHPTVAGIIDGGHAYSAVDFAHAMTRRQALLRKIQSTFNGCDALFVPSAPRYPSLDEDRAEPIAVNATLGRYTNFVNLADLCAVALPAGWRGDGLPFGITVIAPAFSEALLGEFAHRWRRAMPATLGCSNRSAGVAPPPADEGPAVEPDRNAGIELAVVGAHLRGQPLEHQLTSRGAVFLKATTTAARYRLYALPDTSPPKPGLARVVDAEEGTAIALELWRLTPGALGELLAEVPPPLGIGSVELVDGRWVRGFICEGHALEAATDISRHGGWRDYLDATRSADSSSASGVAHG